MYVTLSVSDVRLEAGLNCVGAGNGGGCDEIKGEGGVRGVIKRRKKKEEGKDEGIGQREER